MSPEELDEWLMEHGEECYQHGPDCEDEDCVTIQQQHESDAIESNVEMGAMTEDDAIEAHRRNGTWTPTPDEEQWAR
jgi:hypothetical protein